MEWRKLKIALFTTIYMLAIVWLAFFMQIMLSIDIDKVAIFPREWVCAANFLISPLFHVDVDHVVNNSIAFLILSLACFYFYGGIALSVILGGIGSGVFVWLFGREAYHVGLSGVCYSLASFLFVSGIIRKNISLRSISLLIVFWQGGLVWGMIPSLSEPLNISWEGHLFGAMVGFIMAFIWKKRGPKDDPEIEDERQEDYLDFDEQLEDDRS